jgi:redox-sensitive bicupin YhaK (pirin superfamily)
LYLDLHLPAGARFRRSRCRPEHNAFVYVYRAAKCGSAAETLPVQRMAILANDAEATA